MHPYFNQAYKHDLGPKERAAVAYAILFGFSFGESVSHNPEDERWVPYSRYDGVKGVYANGMLQYARESPRLVAFFDTFPECREYVRKYRVMNEARDASLTV